jgi:hypothetical protein
MREKLTTIAISRRNHILLSKLGIKGQSFDDVLTRVLDMATGNLHEKKNPLQSKSLRVDRSEALAAEVPITQTALEDDSSYE